jgi:hypothetical protein
MALDIGNVHKTGRVSSDYYEYISDFQEGLLNVMKSNSVDESNLFALFLVIHSARQYSRIDPNEEAAYHTYINMFCAVLRHLIRQHPKTHRKPLWRYSLSFVRRTLYRTLATPDEDILLLSLDSLDAELPGNYSYQNLFTASPLYYTPQIDNSSLHNWNVRDILISLAANFRITYLDQFSNPSALATEIRIEKEKEFVKLLYDVRHRSNTFEKFQYIDRLFEVRLLHNFNLF